jgi:ATP-dependent DNA helicase RecQ
VSNRKNRPTKVFEQAQQMGRQKMIHYSRLSSIPQFLLREEFWGGVLDPRVALLRDSKFGELRTSTASHRWAIEAVVTDQEAPDTMRTTVLDVAQGILERGAWAPPTWRLEQKLASLFERDLGWEFERKGTRPGMLSLSIQKAKVDGEFEQSLVAGRWAAEAPEQVRWETWSPEVELEQGSTAEREFFLDVLCPVLGFPLLDFLIPQRSLSSMGLDTKEFVEQRVDFALDTGRSRIKLVIEIDGDQHLADGQRELDLKRDKWLQGEGWGVWRVPVRDLADKQRLRTDLEEKLKRPNGDFLWGKKQLINSPRDRKLLTCVWGSTVTTRIQFLLLEALRVGLLSWREAWRIVIVEHDTDIALEATADLEDWFGHLCQVYGLPACPTIETLPIDNVGSAQIAIDVSVIQPHLATIDASCPVAWSRPANLPAPSTKRRFSTCRYLDPPPAKKLLEKFTQDLFRINDLREGQYEILSRILSGRDVIGLLPTGGGKSLTYQLMVQIAGSVAG